MFVKGVDLEVMHMSIFSNDDDEGLLNNMVRFFLHKDLKAWRNNFATFFWPHKSLRCMSSKQNTTPDFKLHIS